MWYGRAVAGRVPDMVPSSACLCTLLRFFLPCREEYLHCPQKLICFLYCFFFVVETCTAPNFYRNNLLCPVWLVNTCTALGGGKKQPVLPISLNVYYFGPLTNYQ